MPGAIEYIVDEQGKKTKVVLPFSAYEQLLEDLHDLAVIAERRDGETMILDELRTSLANDNDTFTAGYR
ncbi:type II toxin-antitoxin system prevent-host-death family antitoxin [soil metagenome]